MSTADEIMLMRADAMPRLERIQKGLNDNFMGMFAGMRVHVVPDHLKDLMTIKKWKVEKLPGKKKRKGYRVVSYREPCAIVINTDLLRLRY